MRDVFNSSLKNNQGL